MSGSEVNTVRKSISELKHTERVIVSQWLTAVFEQDDSKESKPFRVTFDREKITVSSSHHEPDAFTNHFHLCMAKADLTHSVSWTPSTIRVIGMNSMRDAAGVVITEIEAQKLQTLLESNRAAQAANQSTVEEPLVDTLPDLVKRRLKHFEPEMQTYIRSCFAKYSKPTIGLYALAPASLQVPVLLPNLDLLGAAAECRDLMQILSEPPASKSGVYRDRYTGKHFRLNELSPAPQASFTTSPDQAMREYPHTHHAPNGRR